MSPNRRTQLLKAAQTFCTSFASQKPPEEIFGLFSTSDDVTAYEHGLPQLAPFLGREYKGPDGIRKYFETISSLLTYENMRFSNYVVDEVEGKVSVRGEATFTWTSSGQSWDEVFTYVLAFDEGAMVLKYEIWADSGAAFLASRGELNGDSSSVVREGATITSYFSTYVPPIIPQYLADPESKPHLALHIRKPGRKLTNWPVEPAIALFQVENQVVSPEPCISFGGKRPRATTPPPAAPPRHGRDSPPPRPVTSIPIISSSAATTTATTGTSPPRPPPVPPKRPKKGHPLILRLKPPKIDDDVSAPPSPSSQRPPHAVNNSSFSSSASARSDLSVRPVSKLPLWVREQRRRQAKDARKQTRYWEKQLHSAERHPGVAQVHKKGSRTTL